MNEFDDLARKFILPKVEKNIENMQKQTDQSGEAIWDSFGHFIDLSNDYED